MDWIALPQDWDRWLLNVVMNPGAYKIGGTS